MKPLHESLTMCIEHTMNAWLDTDPHTVSRLSKIENLVIGLEITTFPLRMFFLPTAERINVLASTDRQVHTQIRGRLIDLIRLATGELRPGDGTQLTIEGDVATGHAFQHLLKTSHFDWEELLSQHVGDIAAHGLAKGGYAAKRWIEHSFNLLNEAAGEYLTEETELVAGRHQINSFIREVDKLRDKVEALETSAENLKRK